jgi:tRNA-2-methylthio-N6-dimethylallyladenosine synthase
MTNVYIETYGCQMNAYDTELVQSILVDANMHIIPTVDAADVALLNTCSVRENANNKVLNRIHALKRANKTLIVGILGCMATNFKTQLLDNNRLQIDLIAGPDSYKQLPALIADAVDATHSDKPFDVTLSEFETYDTIVPNRTEGANAWLAIMRGCNNFCTFCVVPYTRGRERSRSADSIITEINDLVAKGYKQVTLLGQNVNSYRYGNDTFTDLMRRITQETAIDRIRFTSPHPKDFPDDLLDVIAANPAICKQIHVPLQAGNDRILKKMNRTYTQSEFLTLIHKMRDAIPGVALSTDIIVGFPTETYDEFLDTVRVCETVKFDHAYIFKYSERPNTRAALKFPDDVPLDEKTQRITELVKLQKKHSLHQNKRWVNTVQSILVERWDGETVIGRNDANVLVYVDAAHNRAAIGSFTNVFVTDASPHGLRARALSQ